MKKIYLFILLFFAISYSFAQNYKVGCIAFYNIENLFDTIDSPNTHDSEFLPDGARKWNSEKYYKKLDNMARVISEIGTELVPTGPAVIGLSEVENRSVLEDLVKRPLLASRNYQIVHFDSPDERGVDVAFLYQPNIFKLTNARAVHITNLPENDKTRDLLVISGYFDGEMMHFLVNHWPSRGGGQKESEIKRILVAQNDRAVIDSILKTDPNAKIVFMGDLNDDPIDKSVKVYMRTKGKIKKLQDGDLYNPMEEKFKSGDGTLGYNDAWNLFDQLIISQGLIGEDKSTYKFKNATVFRKPYLITKEGQYEGYPLRTFSYDEFINGYSDHLPVYLYIVKEVK